jgi:hypothetical protein
MSATFQSLPLAPRQALSLAGFSAWLRSHRDASTMAGLLAFAAPVTFFVGALSVMREPTVYVMSQLGLWWLLYGFEFWALLLFMGYGETHLASRCGSLVRAAAGLLGACATAAFVTLSTAGRASVLAEQGVVQSALTMHLHASVFSFTMVLLFFAHLRRSRVHAAAAARLTQAQAAHRDARRGMAQARLAAVQARVDPQLLFGMLDAVRRAYQADAPRAECLLDELIAFLRAALPQLPTTWSSVPREAGLARSYAGLHALAGQADVSLKLDVSPDAMHARFPPGVVLPLLDDALRTRASPCALTVTGARGACRLALTLPVRPSQEAQVRVRALLADVYGAASAQLKIEAASGGFIVTAQVPYELA